MSSSFDWRIIDRHLAGEATPAEEAELRAWLAEDPRRSVLIEEARRPVSGETWNVDAAWKSVSSHLRTPASVTSRFNRSLERRQLGSRYAKAAVRIAAMLLLTVGAAFLWRTFEQRKRSGSQIATRALTTVKGQRAELRLDDGTRVVLGVESRLDYPEVMDGASREVQLSGEAYFEVSPDSSRPFRVRTASAVTRVLGTEFTVRAYPGTEAVEVAVTSGRVSLGRSDTSVAVVLGKGQLGELRAQGAPTVRSVANLDPFVAWTEGRLAFDGTAFGDALLQLERWYDVDFVVADSALAARRLSARFRAESLNEALDAIALALGARYERAGRTIRFMPRRTRAR
jgi:transmembrane sensor